MNRLGDAAWRIAGAGERRGRGSASASSRPGADPPVPAQRRDRLWRLSDRAAAGRRMALRTPTVLHEAECGDGQGQRFLAGASDAIAAGFPTRGCSARRCKARRRHRQSGAAHGDRGGGIALSRLCRRQACGFWSPAARRARGSCRTSFRPPSGCCPRSCARRLVIVQQTRGEEIARVREAYARARAWRPRSRPSFPICRCASRRRILVIAAPAPRPSRSLR